MNKRILIICLVFLNLFILSGCSGEFDLKGDVKIYLVKIIEL